MPIPNWLPQIAGGLAPTMVAGPQGVSYNPIGRFTPTAQTPAGLLPRYFNTQAPSLLSLLPKYLQDQQSQFFQGGNLPQYLTGNTFRGASPDITNPPPLPNAQAAAIPSPISTPPSSGPAALAQMNTQRTPRTQSSSAFNLPNYYDLPALPSMTLSEDRKRSTYSPFPKYRA